MGGIGPMSLIIIGIVALLIFGPKKLPELGKAFGSTLREFKNATRGLADEDDDDKKKKELDK
ncbi:sec-independent protein translocase protein TatA [Lysinibacillus sp. RC46]|uniref:twin-arginine translocase TatA/TatE family subunit n=1 Tax=unclassified Lysinibacillus TaxID=2636778 RepID=UPI0035188407